MLVKDTTVNDKPLNAVVIPEVMVRDVRTYNSCLKLKMLPSQFLSQEVSKSVCFSGEDLS